MKWIHVLAVMLVLGLTVSISGCTNRGSGGNGPGGAPTTPPEPSGGDGILEGEEYLGDLIDSLDEGPPGEVVDDPGLDF